VLVHIYNSSVNNPGLPSAALALDRNGVEDRRIIDEMVDSVTVEQSGLAIALHPGAAANGQSTQGLGPVVKAATISSRGDARSSK
jgi:hypothetical protein